MNNFDYTKWSRNDLPDTQTVIDLLNDIYWAGIKQSKHGKVDVFPINAICVDSDDTLTICDYAGHIYQVIVQKVL